MLDIVYHYAFEACYCLSVDKISQDVWHQATAKMV